MVTESMILYGVLFVVVALLSLVRAFTSRKDYSAYFYGRTEEEAVPPRKPVAHILAPLGTRPNGEAPAAHTPLKKAA